MFCEYDMKELFHLSSNCDRFYPHSCRLRKKYVWWEREREPRNWTNLEQQAVLLPLPQQLLRVLLAAASDSSNSSSNRQRQHPSSSSCNNWIISLVPTRSAPVPILLTASPIILMAVAITPILAIQAKIKTLALMERSAPSSDVQRLCLDIRLHLLLKRW